MCVCVLFDDEFLLNVFLLFKNHPSNGWFITMKWRWTDWRLTLTDSTSCTHHSIFVRKFYNGIFSQTSFWKMVVLCSVKCIFNGIKFNLFILCILCTHCPTESVFIFVCNCIISFNLIDFYSVFFKWLATNLLCSITLVISLFPCAFCVCFPWNP